MKYNEVPFIIYSASRKISTEIGKAIGRESNTVYAKFNEIDIKKNLEKGSKFSADVFHLKKNDKDLIKIIEFASKHYPDKCLIIYSVDILTNDDYRQFILAGATDVITNKDKSFQELRNDVLRALNRAWNIFRLIEKERRQIFNATVVTTNHELNQPLTVILNAVGILRQEIKSKCKDSDRIEKHLQFILKGSNKIRELLDILKDIKEPKLISYMENTPMIALKTGQKESLIPKNINKANIVVTISVRRKWHDKIRSLVEYQGLNTLKFEKTEDFRSLSMKMLEKIICILVDTDQISESEIKDILNLKYEMHEIPVFAVIKNKGNAELLTKEMKGTLQTVRESDISSKLKSLSFKTSG